MATIGIDARLTYYRIGGISTYILQLIRALEDMQSPYEYKVLYSRKAKRPPTSKFDSAKLWTPSHHRYERMALSAELLRYRLDLLHSPDFIPPYRSAKYHVITVHDLTFLHYPEYLTSDSRAYYADQIDVAVKQADHILCDSEATKRDLIQMLGVEPNKITVHMLGVDEIFKPLQQDEMSAVKQSLGLPDEYILHVGTIEPRKNIIGLIRAYHQLLSKVENIPPLVLVGKRGWLYEETIKKIDELQLNDNVIWLQNINDFQLLPTIYNLATVLVMPSYYEGFGLPALEAMACGTVPIVSNRSSLPEIVGDVGLQIDPDQIDEIADAIEYTLAHPDWRQETEARAIIRASEFTWRNTAEIVLNTYKQILES